MRLPRWKFRQNDDLDEEIRSHLAMAARDREARGEPPVEAAASARREFGNVLLVKEVAREMWGWISLERFLQDIRYGCRLLVRSPGFTVVAILTLALGIGVNSALFSVVNGVLFSALPYPAPDKLVTLHMSKPNFETGAISYPNFLDWQAQNHTFSAMALSRSSAAALIGAGDTEYLRINYVTSDFFPLLGVNPVVGRNLSSGEDKIGRPPLAQISEGLWKRKFGSQPVLGRSLNLSGKSYTVIGVIPASFDLQLGNFSPTDIYLPIGQWMAGGLKMRGAPLGLHGVGRLKPGVSLEEARADMETVSRNLANAFPDTNRANKANLIPLKQSITGAARPVLLLLLGSVGFVLLIACVNVASLLLARSESRTSEFAVRTALGASRVRILRQLLTESLLLALMGGTLGVLLAAWGTHAALRLVPQTVPRIQQIHVDARVLVFSVVISLAAGILFGFAPAFKIARPKLQTGLRASSGRFTGERQGAQRALVVMEIALALVLLVGAGLMLRTLAYLWRVDPGFDPRNVMVFGVSLSPAMADATPEATRSAVREVRDTLQSTPGVEAVSLRDGTIPMCSDNELLFWMAGQPQTDSEKNWALRYTVQPSYLQTMRIALLRGRFFSPQDTEKPARVVAVDDVFATTFFPHRDAIGQRIRWKDNNRIEEAEIVGIVGHVKQWGLDSDDTNSLRAQVYESYDQLADDNVDTNFGVTIRAGGPPLALVPTLIRRLQQLNSENALYTPLTLESIVAQSLATRRFSMIVLALFAVLALLLAAIGIYGVVSYVVARRQHEIGIRMALGAQRGQVLRLVLGQGVLMACAGVAIGTAAALGLTRLMSGLLYGVQSWDPITFAAAALSLAVIALSACWLPARRATRVDPMLALRYE